MVLVTGNFTVEERMLLMEERMDERRKNKRTNMPSKLVIKRLDGDDDRQVSVVITDLKAASDLSVRNGFKWGRYMRLSSKFGQKK